MATDPILLPMLAKELDRSENGKPVLPWSDAGDWRMEPKLDGWRFLASVRVDGTMEWYGGRNGALHTSLSLEAPGIVLMRELPTGTILDGEVIVNEPGASSGDVSTALASGAPIQYVVFDIVLLAGTDVRHLPYRQRRHLLERIRFDGVTTRLVPSVEISQSLYEAWVTNGPLEGVMVKRLDGRYESGKRSRAMLKGKPQMSLDGIIVGFVEGKNGRSGTIGALEVEITDGNYVAEYGPGKTTRVACPPWLSAEILMGGTFHGAAGGALTARAWIGRHIEFRYSLMFKGGTPRHPVFSKLREDRDV